MNICFKIISVMPSVKIFLKNFSVPVEILSLTELSAKAVAHQFPFELVEKYYSPVPEQLQLRIAFWSFPESDDDIRYEFNNFWF